MDPLHVFSRSAWTQRSLRTTAQEVARRIFRCVKAHFCSAGGPCTTPRKQDLLHQLLWAADGKGLQMAAGNEKADFANIVLPYLPDALTMATWLAGNRADAEDIVQEGCL